MRVGVPKEVKVHEYRVGLVPGSVRELALHGHEVLVETGAGAAIGFPDAAYVEAGARIAPDAAAVFDEAELIVKVKEPQPFEWARLKPHHVLFTYLHLAPDPAQTKGLMESGSTAIAYETVTDAQGGLPLLAPMSEVAGRMAVQVGARCLEKEAGGAGILLSGVPGVPPGRVVIIGGGVVGSNAARIANGMRANVTVLDRNPRVLAALDIEFNGWSIPSSRRATRWSARCWTQTSSSAPCWSPARPPRGSSRAPRSRACVRAASWSMSRSTRAGASRRPAPPPMPTRPMWWMAWCITASRTCLARWRAPARWR